MEFQWHDKEDYENQLRTGLWWEPRDRIQKYWDLHAWEMSVTWAQVLINDNHHKKMKRDKAHLQYPDLLWPWENKYEYEMKNLENFVSMLQYVPHCEALVPQLQRELNDLLSTRVTQLKDKFQVEGLNHLVPGDEMKRMRTYRNMYKAPDSGPMITPWFGDQQSNQRRLPDEQGRAIYKWREKNPQTAPAHPDAEKTELANWIQEFEQNVESAWVDEQVEKQKWVKMFYIDATGDKHRVYGMVGETLLEVTRRWEVPLDGYCMGGDRNELYGWGPTCQFCQIDVAPRWVHTLPPMDWKEEHWTQTYRVLSPTSRLACQIVVTAQMDGFTCSIPQMEGSQSADMG